MTEYLKKRKFRLDERRVKDSSLFGLMLGTILIIISFLRWIVSYSNMSYFWEVSGVIGFFLFMTGALVPQCITCFYNGMRYVGNKIGNIIFSVLLFIVYAIFVIPISFFIKDRKKDYSYILWDDEYKGEETSCFLPWKEKKKVEAKGIRGATFGLIQYFILNGKIIFVPVVIILLMIGIILFFVSSSVFAPFIYTLF